MAIVPEPRPVVLGIAAWLALAGWKLLVPPIAFALAHGSGGEPTLEMPPLANAAAVALGCIAYAVPGYVAARTAARKPLVHALWIGVVVAILALAVEVGVDAAMGDPAGVDLADALVGAAITIVAAQVGGTLAVWQMSERGAARWGARKLPLRVAAMLLVAALVPYVVIVAAFAQ
jgi:hypothetical protein